MKTKLYSLMVAVAVIAALFTSCSTGKTYYRDVETKLVSTDGSGIYNVRVQGKAKTPRQAYVTACKKAVDEVLFKKNLHSEGQFQQVHPVFDELRVKTENQEFFNGFFSDGGAYEQFLIDNKYRGDRYARKVKTKSSTSYAYETDIKVDRATLRSFMVSKGLPVGKY